MFKINLFFNNALFFHNGDRLFYWPSSLTFWLSVALLILTDQVFVLVFFSLPLHVATH